MKRKVCFNLSYKMHMKNQPQPPLVKRLQKNALNVLLNYQSLFGTFACNHTNTKCQIIKKELNLRCGAMLIYESMNGRRYAHIQRHLKAVHRKTLANSKNCLVFEKIRSF